MPIRPSREDKSEIWEVLMPQPPSSTAVYQYTGFTDKSRASEYIMRRPVGVLGGAFYPVACAAYLLQRSQKTRR